MLYLQNQDSRYEFPEDTVYKIKWCNFNNLNVTSSKLKGGAFYCSKGNSNIYCTECEFHQCSATTSGGIHIEESNNIDISKICATYCSNEALYSMFAYIYSKGSLQSSLFSTHFCTGALSTTCFFSIKISVDNINSTHNSGIQESSFLLRGANFGTLRFAEASSNRMKLIGMNYFNGTTYFASHIHYRNCSCSDDDSVHIFTDKANDTYIFDSYIETDPQDTCYIFSVSNASMYIHNIYMIGSQNIHTGVQVEEESTHTLTTKTLIYSLLNTKMCPAFVETEYTIYRKEKNLMFRPLLYCAIVLLNK